MTVIAFHHNYSPIFVFINGKQELLHCVEAFLHINIGHSYFVKVLYFIIGFLHLRESTTMRQKPKSKADSFHESEGGAVPTLTHH